MTNDGQTEEEVNLLEAEIGELHPRPTVVCLCGSTRFIDTFREAEYEETLKGNIVLTIGCDTKSDSMSQLPPGTKTGLDLLHFAKIEMADEVYFLNVGGYLGESSRRELRHARALSKDIRWLEPDKAIPAETLVWWLPEKNCTNGY